MAATPKTHFRSPWRELPAAICGSQRTTPKFISTDPDKVTCAYCRKRNLAALARQYPPPAKA